MVDFKKQVSPQGKQNIENQRIQKKAELKSTRKSRPGIQISQRERLTRVFMVLLILVYTAFLFSNALHNNFLDWDDNSYIKDNPDIKALDGPHLKAMFSNYYVANWQPLTVITYAIEYSIAGMTSPFLYHLDNLLLHLLNILLVFWFLILLFRNKWMAALAALLFAIHPLRVESVSWIAERKDVLYGFFFLLAMIMYHFYLAKGLNLRPDEDSPEIKDKKAITRYYLFVLLFFVLSALSKSAAVILPLVLLIMDFLYRRKWSVMLVIEKLPFLVISVIFGVLALKSQAEAIKELPQFTPFVRLLLINFSILRYLYMTLVPASLSALHPYPELHQGALPIIYYIAPLFTLIIIALLVFSLRFTRKVMFAFLFFLASIVLVLQFIQVGETVVAERYTYIPHIGLFAILAYYVIRLWEKPLVYQVVNKIMIILVVGCGLLFFSYKTYTRNPVWAGPISLWTDVLEKYPNTAFSAYYNRGKAKHDLKDWNSAYADYEMAIKIKPDHYKAFTNRGLIKQGRGDLEGAIADYNTALKYAPNDHVTYVNRGAVRMTRKEYTEAEADFKRAIELKPDVVESWYNLGLVKYQLKDYQGAIMAFTNALKLRDPYLDSYNYLGSSKYFLGDKEGACASWRTGNGLGDPTCKQNLERLCN
jgi:protein O-mannosyl-transferase